MRHEIRINDVNIRVKGNLVFVSDIFGDISAVELQKIIEYLENEGFLPEGKEIHVFIKSQSFMQGKEKDHKKG